MSFALCSLPLLRWFCRVYVLGACLQGSLIDGGLGCTLFLGGFFYMIGGKG